MAKSFSPAARRNLAEAAHDIEHIEPSTIESLAKLDEQSDKEQVLAVAEIVTKDLMLNETDRSRILSDLKQNFFHVFKLDECSQDYQTLKAETKFLLGINQSSFILMAQRLTIIRDNRLYEQDNYSDFKEFIINELPIAKTTVYCYIDVVKLFGVQSSELAENLDYSKLFPLLPLLKADDKAISEEKKMEIKKEFLQKIKEEPARQIKEEAKILKEKYGLTKHSDRGEAEVLARQIEVFKKQLPSTLNQSSLSKIKELKDYLNKIIKDNNTNLTT